MHTAIQKKIQNLLLLSVMIFFSACKHSHWGETLTRQTDQPNSIIQVDSEVVNLMVKYRIPGMSIAISKNGKMIYAKGYGYANKAKEEEVTTKTLFRIGRISELITAVAIMQLVEEGKISPGSKVFGDSGILGNEYGSLRYGANSTSITVNQLLHHNFGGWAGVDDLTWNNKSLDRANNPGELISLSLKNIPLRTSPGKSFAFSDMGYLILGRIIEKISGLSYNKYVKEKILKKLGIPDMEIEGRSAEDIRPNESVHYSDATFAFLRSERIDDEAYGYTALGDACYGWIATPQDLLKLITSLDDSIPKTPLLSPNTLKMLLSADTTNPSIGCGMVWNNTHRNWYDLGEYRGSTSEIAHTDNGYCWAIFVNTYRPAIDTYLGELDHILWNAIDNPKTSWPNKDLF